MQSPALSRTTLQKTPGHDPTTLTCSIFGVRVDIRIDDAFVYDLGCDQAYCLEDVTALVWRAADGHTPVDVIIELVRQQSKSAIADEDVWAALESLSKAHLLVSAIQRETAATVPSINPGENR